MFLKPGKQFFFLQSGYKKNKEKKVFGNMEVIQQAKPHRNIRTDNESKFNYVQSFLKGDAAPVQQDVFAVQIVHHPNFNAHLRDESWFVSDEQGARLENTKPEGFRKENSFKNYRTDPGVGHLQGIFYEFNLYNRSPASSRRPSTTSGNQFPRDPTIDKQ